MIKKVTYAIFLMVFLSKLNAQDLSASLDKDTILIGDHLKLTLQVNVKESEKVFFPIFEDSVSSFDVIQNLPVDTQHESYSKSYVITQFTAGNYQIAQLPTVVQRSNGITDTLYAAPLQLVVNTVEVDTTQAFKPIKTVKSIPFPWKEFLKKWAIIIIPIMLLIIGLLWYLAKRKKLFVKEEKPKTMLDYYNEALQKLEEIDNKKLWQNDEIKTYYFGISETLRTYLEGRYKIHAMESTTDEIKEQLVLDKAFKDKLTLILSQADLAKFAKFRPLNDENLRMMKMAKDFVKHTKPKEQETKDAK